VSGAVDASADEGRPVVAGQERSAARVRALREALAETGADAFLATHPASVRYLSGFSSPDDGRVLVTDDEAWLVTDGRYTVQAEQESWLPFHVTREWIEWVAESAQGARIAVEADHLTLAQHDALCAAGAQTVSTSALVARARAVKDAEEQALIREAARITDAAYAAVTDSVLRPGVRELDVALALERAMREAGAEGIAFEIIVASGPRSAMPHGVASTRVIESGDLVTMDFGARVSGYHADMTRAVAVGPISDRLRELFDAVLAAQEAAVAAIRPGLSGIAADAIARDRLEAAGLASYFAHSLGHGVGLEIHEGPRLSAKSQDVLAPNMTVTVEPGVYVPGVGGVRIEDLVLVTDDAHEVLSSSPKGFREV
jgi:Xaa-Pro aminopeptidase